MLVMGLKDPLYVSVTSEFRQDDEEGKKVEEEKKRKGRAERAALNRQGWGDCKPQVSLLREALLSEFPAVAVIGPLQCCFSFYMTQLHNEVLSSSYGRTMVFGADISKLESSFMWMGGWRPTAALVLVYSLMGIQVEDALDRVRRGKPLVVGSTTAVLTPRQLQIMDNLQKLTQQSEIKLTKKHAVMQMLIGDQDMLTAVMSDAASSVSNDSSRFDRATEKRMVRFRRLLVQAEDLRLHTLKYLLSLLTPIQAAQCGIAVFEICSSMSELGKPDTPLVPVIAIIPRAALPFHSPLIKRVPLQSTPPSIIEAFVSDVSIPICFPSPADVVRNNLSDGHDTLVPLSTSPPLYPFLPQDFNLENCPISLSTNQPQKWRQTDVPSGEYSKDGPLHEEFKSKNVLLAPPSVADGIVREGEVPRSPYSNGSDAEKLQISNRLLILDTNTSDVVPMQECSRETQQSQE